VTGTGEPVLQAVGLVHRFPNRWRRGCRAKGEIEVLRGVSLDLLRGECLAVVGESGSGKTTLARALLRLIQPTGGEVLHEGKNVLTMGRDGMLLASEDGRTEHFPSLARRVFDVTGAGDVVMAALASALSEGRDVRDAVDVANRAAGLAVEQPGTSVLGFLGSVLKPTPYDRI